MRPTVAPTPTPRVCAKGSVAGGGIGDELLVPQNDGPLRSRARRCDVPPPGPGGPARVARLHELLPALGLDPEARVDAVRQVGVVALVASFRAQPPAFEEGAHDVASVAHDVHGRGRRKRAQCCGQHEAGLGRLLDAAQAAHEREPTDALQHVADLDRLLPLGKLHEVGDRSLQQRHFTEVDERGEIADRARREARAGARRAHDEHEPFLARAVQARLGSAHCYAYGGRAVR